MKTFFSWFIAIVITLTAVVYQRMTGPTNPRRESITLMGEEYSLKFPRSLETLRPLKESSLEQSYTSQLKIKLTPPSTITEFYILWRRYPSNDTLQKVVAAYSYDYYSIELPSQPPAGKIIYYPYFTFEGSTESIPATDDGIILRYKAPVSPSALIPHILLMFIAMLLSNFAGIATLFKLKSVQKVALLTVITLFLGGLIFGPLVQQAAFGDYWTGWPLGGDLTDTKTFFVFLVWLAAWFFNRKKTRRYLYIVASVIMLLVYTIPHSTAGSEYNYEEGKVITGSSIS